MDMRAEVWSPLQNTAVWLGAWLYGHEPTDNVVGAIAELNGSPEMIDGSPFIDFLAQLRRQTSELIDAGPGDPLLRLILSGPGEAPLLPAGSQSALAAAGNDAGAIIARTNDPNCHLVIIRHLGHTTSQWQIIEEADPIPAPAWLTPGDADALLTQATNESARLIESTGYSTNALHNPRLTVGALSDFYDTPGLPSAVPPRAAKLFARADTVAAIIETVTARMGDHSLDPHLLTLWRHIRAARAAGVAYAVNDFAR